jgi:hypothetical protein
MRRCRCTSEIEAARLQHDLHGLVVERIGLGVAAATRPRPSAPSSPGGRSSTPSTYWGCASALQVLDHLVHLVVGDEGAVHALR